ncbi:MAG: Uncharacterized protein XD58_0265 [Thermotoga sp. 50_1627]|nr:MAG: Uncharacterized protein XD45_0505 [Thermotoga sp. 50_64]KUK25828.1 MAG: Uncharacterized protein XD58_0265 [Thermotoga sp. 50_1627]
MMALDKEIVTRVCAQLTKYLLERSAESLNISITKAKKYYEVRIVSKVFLKDEELNLLKSYLNVQPQEVGYYYLPLIGEYGSEEDLAIIAMLLKELDLNYDESSHELVISFRVR